MTQRRNVGDLHLLGCTLFGALTTAIIECGGVRVGMADHLLYCHDVDTGIEHPPDKGAAEIMGRKGLERHRCRASEQVLRARHTATNGNGQKEKTRSNVTTVARQRFSPCRLRRCMPPHFLTPQQPGQQEYRSAQAVSCCIRASHPLGCFAYCVHAVYLPRFNPPVAKRGVVLRRAIAIGAVVIISRHSSERDGARPRVVRPNRQAERWACAMSAPTCPA